MNFSEALKELDNLNEELLMEKKWIAILPKKLEGQAETDIIYYKFLTVDDPAKQKADVLQMLGTHTGTYKQMLHKEYLAELRKKIKAVQDARRKGLLSDPEDFDIIRGEAVDQLDADKVKKLTLGDRYLRQQAHNSIDTELKQKKKELGDKQQGSEPELSKKPIDLQTTGYLVHHINGYEDENKPSNLVIVPYTKGDKEDLKIATGIHSVLHQVATPDKVKSGPINFDTKIYRLDSQYNLVEGICHITINLPKVKS